MNKPVQPLSATATAAAAAKTGGKEPSGGSPSKLEQARKALAKSTLSVAAPGRGADTSAPLIGGTTVVSIPIRDIGFYERNPRSDPNDKFDDIKESIRLAGLDSVLQVMRLPGAGGYVVAKGGNTRLKALKELFSETNDPRFEYVTAQIVPFRGHTAAIADHLKENTLRGAMSFYDKAKACLDIQQEIAQETGKEPGIRELVGILRNQYGLTTGMDHATLGRYLHVAQHFHSVRLWMTQVTSKALIPAYNSLLRLALKFEKTEAEVHQELHAALERVASRLALGGGGSAVAHAGEGDGDEVVAPSFDTLACIKELQASVCVYLGLTAYQLDFALGALEIDPNASKEAILTSPQPPVSARTAATGLNKSSAPGQKSSLGAEAGTGTGDGAGESGASDGMPNRSNGSRTAGSGGAVGAQSALDLALALGRETAAAREAGVPWSPGAGQGGDKEPSPPGAKPRNKPQTVDEVLDQIIDVVTRFCEACGVGDLCSTSLSLPSGYIMEMPAQELILPTEAMRDARIRVGGWWMAAMLAKHFDEEHSRLFPTTSLWRAAWVREDASFNPNEERPDQFHVVQQHLGAVLGDDGRPALQLEFMFEVLSDAHRAQLFADLTRNINNLQTIRNGGAA